MARTFAVFTFLQGNLAITVKSKRESTQSKFSENTSSNLKMQAFTNGVMKTIRHSRRAAPDVVWGEQCFSTHGLVPCDRPMRHSSLALIGFRGGEAITGKRGWGPLVHEQKRG